jgi:uncharacterized protein (DUF2236 family)
MSLVARLFGTPASVLPRSYREFVAYWDSQLRSDTITVTQPARTVAEVILAAPLPVPFRLLAPAHRLATTHILPLRLREEYELRWTPLHELALPLASASVRYGTAPILSVVERLPVLSPKLAA